MKNELEWYRQEMRQELQNILAYWFKHGVDLKEGGFAGKIDNDNKIHAEAPKGSVLNSRILWSFSSAYNLTKQVRYLQMAERAFKYITNYFVDTRFGGLYWTVDYRGKPLDTIKQIYAQAFAIYGLSEYFKAFEDDKARKLAISLYEMIVERGQDKTNGGYLEAFTREWKEMADSRLSAAHANRRKSMNTHLHLLEGFANLYRIWPEKNLRQRIVELIRIFLDHIIDAKSNHLVVFFDEVPKEHIPSYGHDIQAAWLIQDAAETISDNALLQEVKHRSVGIADAAAEGMDKDGALWYGYDAAEKRLVKEKHWWVQSGAMVGFFNAWQTTGNQSYFYQSLNSWKFIKNHLLDKVNGEWFWGVTEDGRVMQGYDKVGLWKCPYHNSRACLEIINRIAHLNF